MDRLTLRNNVSISLPEAAFKPSAASFWLGALFTLVCVAIVAQN